MAARGHVAAVRRHVFDALEPGQVQQLSQICDALLTTLDPHRLMTEFYAAPR